MAFPTYSTGTVAIASAATSVIGTGSNWTGVNAVPGDLLVVAGNTVIVQDVVDATTLTIDAWPFTAVTAGAAYSLKKTSPLRFAGGQAMADVSTLVGALNTDGFYVFVGPTLTVPDPSYGNDNQYAFQATTGKLWQKTGGTWNFIGIFKGFGTPAPWDSATAYVAFDVVSLAGTSYVCILDNTNETPPNATYWVVLASKGDAATVAVGTVTTGAGGSSASVTNSGTTGAAVLDFTIPAGEGYGGTSTTSLAIATGSKAFTTQSGLAYQVGNYVRASSAASGVNYMEGNVTAYSGTTLTVNITKIGGSGTKADWAFQVAGAPGSGDLLSTNNLSDLASASTARTNLGSTTVGDALFVAASAAAARTAVGVTAIGAANVGHIPGETSTGSAASGEIGEEGHTSIVSGNFTTTATPQNVTSITVPAGDFEVMGIAQFSGSGSTSSSDWLSIISTTSTPSTSTANAIDGIAYHERTPAGLDNSKTHSHLPWRVSNSTSTTYYLHAAATFTASTYGFQGMLRYRRAR